ncbi:MAG: hypothetical protein GXO33_04320 [Epsilonproteobacteria bacterium]|nr:hypothetical protein [Campylobacterota bacterium]
MNVLLQNTDSQLAAMPPAKRWAVTGVTALLIVAAGWFLWGEALSEEIDTQERKIAQLETKIRKNALGMLGKAIRHTQEENLKLEERIEEYRAMVRYLQTKATGMRFFFFDRRRFMEMFEKVLRRSVDLGIRIDTVSSEAEKGAVSLLIEKKKRVVLEGSGSFPAVTRLTWYIESFGALMKIVRYRYWFDAQKGEPKFSIELLYYGARR